MDPKLIKSAPSTRQMKNLISHYPSVMARMVPTVIETRKDGSRFSMDPFSRLLEDRAIFLTGVIDEISAELARVQLMYLDSLNPESQVYLHVNSNGGAITAGTALIDEMNSVPCDVVTICSGMAASMGAQILLSGSKGLRLSYPNAKIMIHQPLGGNQGQASDMTINTEEINRTKVKMFLDMAERTGLSFEEVLVATDRDNYLSPRQAMELGTHGLIDGILLNTTATRVDGSKAEDDKKSEGKLVVFNRETEIVRRGDEKLDTLYPDVSKYLEMVKVFSMPSSSDEKLRIMNQAKANANARKS